MKLKSPVTRLRRKLFSSLFKKRKVRRVFFTPDKMSVLDNNEIGPTVEVDLNDEPALANIFRVGEKKEPKRILHFSDGTIEEYDSDDSDEDDSPQKDKVEEPFRKSKETEVEELPPVDPKSLTWPSWVKYYTVMGGSKTLSAMDRMGEGVAYYLGITTPKYQYEIDEYYRSREEHLAAKKEEDLEFQTWSASNPSNGPIEVITEEQKSTHENTPSVQKEEV